jgi:hypothetical protein
MSSDVLAVRIEVDRAERQGKQETFHHIRGIEDGSDAATKARKPSAVVE